MKNLTNIWKPIVALAVILYVILSIKACNEKVRIIDDLNIISSTANSELKQKVDENGKLHIITTNINVQREALQLELDSIRHLLDIKPKQVMGVAKTAYKLTVNEKLIVDTLYEIIPCAEDSAKVATGYMFVWKDKWMNVSGSVGTGKDSIHITGVDTLNVIDYWKRKWLFGRKIYYTDYSNSNEHIRLIANKGAKMSRKEKKFSIGLSMQYGYPLSNFQLKKPDITAGISIQYSLIRF